MNIYAFYGAGAGKIAVLLGCDTPEAQSKLDAFWKLNVGIKRLVDYLYKYYKKHKYIVGLDGRKLQIRGEHKLLNTLIQSAAGIIFKRWDVIVTRELLEKKLDCTPIIRMHDEIQYRVHQDVADISQEIVLRGAASAGEYYGLKVPIAADCKLGANLAETHQDYYEIHRRLH